MTSAVLVEARPALASFVPSRSGLVDAFLAGGNERTLAAYRADLEDFRVFAGAATAGEAANRLLAGSHGEANGAALAYKAHMTERGLQAAKTQAYRDTRGPGRDGLPLHACRRASATWSEGAPGRGAPSSSP